mgnify:CR=1 FL=1
MSLNSKSKIPLIASTVFLPHLANEVELNRALKTEDRKSTRLNSSHQISSYAVFCLKKQQSHCE